MSKPSPKTLLIISQVYVPDPASLGQHMAGAAAEMVRRGWRVRVITAARGYDDPRVRYPAREVIDGVEIRRVPLSSFGKSSLPVRVIGALSFLFQATLHGLVTRRLGRVLVSTSPPFASLAALLVSWVRCVGFRYWVMDINPDQAVALGKVRAGSLPVRLFNTLNRIVLGRAERVVTMDEFMAERLRAKAELSDRLCVVPPWPQTANGLGLTHAENPFRVEHGLTDRFVIMFSGNHSPSNPITTILQAAERMREHDRLLFVFVGGGVGKVEVEEAIAAGAPNLRSLPYQSLEGTRHSLPAADVHLVTFGVNMVGLIHPSKVYGAMAVGRPILYLGPTPSHLSRLVEEHRAGWQCRHGDVDAAVATIEAILATPTEEVAAMGERARAAIRKDYSGVELCSTFCDELER